MIGRAKENWRWFKESEQGHCFQDRCQRHQENKHGGFDPRTFLSIEGGILVGGFIAVPGPGFGLVITFLGLGLFVGGFRPVPALWTGPR